MFSKSEETSVIKAKIAYLVKTGLAKPEEICVLAFAKDAKDELRKAWKE